jgi:hypothetical protein
LEVSASFLFLVNILIRDDFPTFERPMTENSGMVGAGQAANVVALLT